LSEIHLGVPGRDRRVAGLVVVARVVEEVDAGLAGGPHDTQALVPADPLVGTPGPERQPADLDAAMAERDQGYRRDVHAASVAPGASRGPRGREQPVQVVVDDGLGGASPTRP